MKYNHTLVKIYTDGDSRSYNFIDRDEAEKSFDDCAENSDIKHAFLINNETGEVEGFEDERG